MQFEPPDELAGWVRAFAFTQGVEMPLYVTAMSLRRFGVPRPIVWRIFVAFLCSLATHPSVWFIFPRLLDAYEDYVLMVIAAETFAVVIEALVLQQFGVRYAFIVSFLVNMTSMSLGFLTRALFHLV